MRIDVFLVEKGLLSSRSRAKELIEKGAVTVSDKIITKPSFDISEATDENDVKIDENENKYVSRGGYKLEALLKAFSIDARDKIALDIGASTGGFTDCLLKHGAKRVFAVDSGTAQLSPQIRCDERVVSIENYNARYLDKKDFTDNFDIVTIDVSFISQTLIIPKISELLSSGALFLSLIKPQFEVGKEFIGKKGIVKDGRARDFAVKKVCDLACSMGFELQGVIESPIYGGDGNIEYLAYFKRI